MNVCSIKRIDGGDGGLAKLGFRRVDAIIAILDEDYIDSPAICRNTEIGIGRWLLSYPQVNQENTPRSRFALKGRHLHQQRFADSKAATSVQRSTLLD